MTEPRKVAIVLLAVMAIGLIALAIEWWKERFSGWMVLLITALFLAALALTIHPIHAGALI